MALIVQKYGGTSVGTVERIRCRAESEGIREQGHDVVVVVSAMSGGDQSIDWHGERDQSATCAARNGCIGIDRRAGHDRLSCDGVNRTWLCGRKLHRWTSPYYTIAPTPRRVFKPLMMKICTPTSKPVGL